VPLYASTVHFFFEKRVIAEAYKAAHFTLTAANTSAQCETQEPVQQHITMEQQCFKSGAALAFW
jgi:hypothetical protein